MDDKILYLYAKGMTTREIVDIFKEMYDADISPTLISRVTNTVIDQIVEWQARPLDSVYPIVYFDCLVAKIRQDKQVINKAVYLVLGVYIEGHKELLGIRWANLNTLFKYPQDISKAIYTTNAIESLNSVIRKSIKKRKLFSADNSAKKVVYLAIDATSKK
jgi:transposase-like protein